MAAAASDRGVVLENLSGEFELSSITCYNLLNLGRFVVNTFENTFNFCCQLNLIKNSRKCKSCKRNLKLVYDRRDRHSTKVSFRCYNKSCRVQYSSIRDGSLFDKSNLSLEQILILANLFCANITSYQQISYQAQLSESRTVLSSATIADWLTYFREICLEIVARETPKLIGGRGLTVEVDESKFGKRKYNKGRLVEGQWVVGGICRETKDIFLAVCRDNKRDADTLLDIIDRHVAKESIVITDCWRAYNRLDANGWQHLTVNHQYNFVGTYSNRPTTI